MESSRIYLKSTWQACKITAHRINRFVLISVVLAESSWLCKNSRAMLPTFVVTLTSSFIWFLMSPFPKYFRKFPGLTKFFVQPFSIFFYEIFFYPIAVLPSSQNLAIKTIGCRIFFSSSSESFSTLMWLSNTVCTCSYLNLDFFYQFLLSYFV